ncbi:MAG: DNA-3-methyladenine glycosylase 2 family protein [Alphaproteobacteria bacterium]|nr:DNA-3-methyladenine glycosylase 2 family protein [Alphaproteobacteria bacterium]
MTPAKMIPAKAVADRKLRQPLATLAAKDHDIAAALAIAGLPPVRRQVPGFPGVLGIIMGQQISVAASGAIRARLESIVTPVTPERFLAQSDQTLRAIGLSGQKIKYGRGIAVAVASGKLDFSAIDAMEDEEIVSRLVEMPGVGRWTAEIYLLFALDRPDVWPAGDLALRGGLRRVKRLHSSPTEKLARKLGESWRPYRSAAARFFWHVHNHPGL